MNDNMNYPDEVLEMLLSRDYHELSSSEKELVSRYISEDEYGDLRKTRLALKSIANSRMNGLKPNPRTKDLLIARLKSNRRPVLIRMFEYRVPMWQAAAAIILLGTCFFFLDKNQNLSSGTVLTQIDTIKVEKPVLRTEIKHDTVFISKVVSPERKLKPFTPSPFRHTDKVAFVDNRLTQIDLHIMKPDQKAGLQNPGNSLKEDTLAQKFKFVTL